MPLVVLHPSDSIPAKPTTTATIDKSAKIPPPEDYLLPADAAQTLLALHHQPTSLEPSSPGGSLPAPDIAEDSKDWHIAEEERDHHRTAEFEGLDPATSFNSASVNLTELLSRPNTVLETPRKGKSIPRKPRSKKALVDPLSPAPSSFAEHESLPSSQEQHEEILPSPEKESLVHPPAPLSKLSAKKIRKKTIEPKPETWNRPLNMGEADVHALDEHKLRILNETKNVSSFVVIGQTLHKLYYEDKLMKTQKEFLEWTKAHLGFSKSTTYEYIISYRIYSDIASKLAKEFRPPMYQSHCQLLSKVPSKKLVDTWVDVCRQAPNGVITTAFLETYLETNNLKVPKSRIASHGCCSDQQTDSKALLEAVAHAKAAIQGSSSSNLAEDDAGGRSSRHPGTGHVDYPTATPRKHGAKTNTISPRHSGSSDGKRIGKHARDDQDILPEPAQRRKTEPDRSQDHNLAHYHPGPVPLPTPMPSNLPVLPPPTDSADDDSDPSDEDARPRLPFNDGFIFELSKNVVMHPQFDMIMQTVADFKAAEQQPWFGRLWCNLSAIRPFSTTDIYGNPANHQASYEGGLERLLEIIFTKFANKEFHEGLFLLRGEFGADWFTPILQHPYCILRHNNPPMAAPPHSDDNGGTSPASASAAYQNGRASNSSARPPPVHTPYETYVMFYLGPNIKEFCTVFRSVGLVPGINSWAAVLNVANVPGLFIPTPAPAPDTMIESNHSDMQHSLSEAASALVEIAGVAGLSGGGGGPQHRAIDTPRGVTDGDANGHSPRDSQ